MQKLTPSISAAIICALLWVGGCVPPGSEDQRMIGRYQRLVTERGPQPRGEEGLEPYRPGQTTQPPLQTVVDEETGELRVLMSLGEAIYRAMDNNLDIRLAGYDPAISRQEMIQAAAVFDAVMFASYTYEHNRNRSPVSVGLFGGGRGFERIEDTVAGFDVGVRQSTPTGATWQFAWNMTRTFDERRTTSIQRLFSNTATLEMVQPLLRNAGVEVNLARLRVARLTHKITMAEFRRQVEQTIADVTVTYWQLIQARRDWLIQKALLDRTIETRDRIDKRRAVDATEVEFKQTEAAVETRRAGLIRAEKTILDVQDQLVRLIGDSQLNLLGDYVILPTTRATTELVQIDPTDQLLTALQHSPLLAQARLAIAISDINVRVAKNQALPQLNLGLRAAMQGLGRTAGDAREELETGDFMSYAVTLDFEYPLGNRERLAEVRRQKLDRLRSITTMQLTADAIASQLRERIRQVTTAHQEMAAQGRAVAASRDQLDALEATEQLRRMSPEFLQVKLSAQETLSNAERAELQAIFNYNVALINLAQVTGTLLELNQVELSMPAVLGDTQWAPEQPLPTPDGESEIPGVGAEPDMTTSRRVIGDMDWGLRTLRRD